MRVLLRHDLVFRVYREEGGGVIGEREGR